MSKPSVLIRKSTGAILKHAPYPKEDMSPVEGLDPDLEWLVKTEPFGAPDYDSRIWELEVDDAITQEPHPEHSHLNQFKRTYKTNKRPDEDIILAIENAETDANQSVVSYNTDEKLFMLAIGILVRKDGGVQPNAKEQAILDQVQAFDVKIWKNDTEKKNKKDQVLAGQEPDIDAGWERE
jgi:hypothetical protein